MVDGKIWRFSVYVEKIRANLLQWNQELRGPINVRRAGNSERQGWGSANLRREVDRLAAISDSKWESIRLAYITTEESFRSLGKRFEVSANAISARSKKENWQDKRSAYKQAVRDEAEKKAYDDAVEQESDKLSKLIQCSDKLDEALETFLVGKVRITEARDVHFIARALKDALEIKRNLHNIHTEEGSEKINLLRAKAKEANAKSNGNGPQQITVTIEGASDDEAKEYAE